MVNAQDDMFASVHLPLQIVQRFSHQSLWLGFLQRNLNEVERVNLIWIDAIST